MFLPYFSVSFVAHLAVAYPKRTLGVIVLLILVWHGAHF